ncbi:hypothetical protein DPMN_130071 [Dreissena polymorpha]|uniref:Uncharacterized protein n=1 Tax=Dreissena polymorpha TaxID=45954 RepID=A0A9D4H5Y6_DREPO|nr:hypothetical protein DPMN_130071 [Dreissena polymorpha]
MDAASFKVNFVFVMLVFNSMIVMSDGTFVNDDGEYVINYMRAFREKPIKRLCIGNGGMCVPGERCCDVMKCANKFGHFCLYPLETCYCTTSQFGNQK